MNEVNFAAHLVIHDWMDHVEELGFLVFYSVLHGPSPEMTRRCIDMDAQEAQQGWKSRSTVPGEVCCLHVGMVCPRNHAARLDLDAR